MVWSAACQVALFPRSPPCRRAPQAQPPCRLFSLSLRRRQGPCLSTSLAPSLAPSLALSLARFPISGSLHSCSSSMRQGSTWRAGPRAGLESGGRAEFHRLHSVYTAHWCHDQARSSNHALCRASDRAATAAVGNGCCGAAAALLRWRRASS